jgi:hypothetical protein
MRPASERFWEKVSKTDGCWLWTAGVDKDGYGTFYDNDHGKNVRAHRFSYEALVDSIPQDQLLDHRKTCPKNCVNPQHLRPVTNKQNLENRVGAQPGSKSGVRGVHWFGAQGLWRATVVHSEKMYVAGYFRTVKDADRAAQELRNKLFTHNDES